MRFVHLSDLHIGKSIVKDDSMPEDQSYILDRIIDIIKEEQLDAVLIAGDIYDRSVPSAEAVTLLDSFLSKLCTLKAANGNAMQTFIISGNHDSPERLAFGNALMSAHGVHISPVYSGRIKPFVMNDEFGEVFIYMLPFIKPVHVRNALIKAGKAEEAEKISSYTDAVKKAVELMNPDPLKRNIIISHQFVTGGCTSDSEVRTIGGLDNVDAAVYSAFNYAALGHLHRPQTIKTEDSDKNVICYSGTPLKYSFSETEDKSIPIVTLDGNGSVTITLRTFSPLRDMRTVEGTFDEIAARSDHNDDYIRIILNEEQLTGFMFRDLRKFYPNLVSVMTRSEKQAHDETYGAADVDPAQSELDIFCEFFERVHGRKPNENEAKRMADIFERVSDPDSEGTVKENASN